jgi:hypothetical protein
LKGKRVITAVVFNLLSTIIIFGQQTGVVGDTSVVNIGSLNQTDTVRQVLRVSRSAIESTVTYKSEGSKINDLVNKRVYLLDVAEVTYGDIFLRADSIVLDMDKGTVYASGRKDSVGEYIGKAFFKEGADEYEVLSLNYNFSTGRAVIRNVITQQEEGFLHSDITKKHEDGTLHLGRSSFTTCDAENPHFRIIMPRSKVYPGEKIVSGPAFLVIEDIPLPLMLPFGYFPVQKKLASGIIMPRYGQEQQRGYFLSEGGFYFAGTDYFDLRVTGNIYSNGTWLATAATRYNLRYRFSGNFSFSYANNINSYRGLEDYSQSRNYRVSWSHSQDPKANPGSRFSARVNMSSSNFDRNNSYQPLENVTTQRNSSISYSKNWEGSPFNFVSSINHSQNVANKTVSLNLPNFVFNVARIYPFRNIGTSRGASRWFHDIQFQYSARFNNQISTYDSLLFTSQVWKDSRAGFKHEIPLSFQLRPFNNFTISPSLSYTGVMYPRKVEKLWVPDYFDPELNDYSPRVITDTTGGVFYGHALTPRIGASFSPQMFIFFTPLNSNSRIEGVRHVIRPTMSFSYVPSIEGLMTPMYREVQADTLGRISTYSIFDNSIYGTPSLPGRSASVNFSLSNILEAKVFERNDTTGKAKKVRLIEGLNLSSNYNIFADSLNWSPVSMNFRTTLLEQFSISASGSFNLYALDDEGKTISKFIWETSNKLARLQTFQASLSFDLGRLLQGGESGQTTPANMRSVRTGGESGIPGASDAGDLHMHEQSDQFDEHGYRIVDLPWSLSVAYSYTYSKRFDKPEKSQQVTFAGDLRIADKTRINYVSGYDIENRQITMTRIGIERDLHCWNMSFNWVPTGYLKSWDFTLRVTSSLLSDIKYERRRDYRDNF